VQPALSSQRYIFGALQVGSCESFKFVENNAKTINKLVFSTWENGGVGYQVHQVDFFRAQVFLEKCYFRGVGAEAPPPPCALVSATYS